MARRAQAGTNAEISRTREAIQADVKRFLESGKKIRKVEPGATGQDEKNRSKHIVISRKV